MRTGTVFISLFLFCSFAGRSQQVQGVYKIDRLLHRIQSPDTVYVVNFWATWCKPCVRELPAFDSLAALVKNKAVKVLLVSLDFREDKNKVNAFLKKNGMKAECVLLDEINGNSYISRISTGWEGSIPATLFKKDAHTLFYETKLRLSELQQHISEL